MKVTLNIILMVLVSFILLTCKKDKKPTECNNANTVKYPADVVRKTFFKDSTYWIYQDSATGLVDSVWVTNSQTGSINKFRHVTLHKKCYQWFSYELRSKFDDVTLVNLGFDEVSDNNEYANEKFRVTYYFTSVGSGNLYGDRFLLDGDVYNVHPFEGDTLIFLNEITIQNVKYGNIIHRINEPMTYDICKEIWYADNVGIIKYKMQNNSVWELVRCKIRQ